MDIKEAGITGVIIIGGVAYGFTSYSLGDVLDEDVRHVSEIPMAERAAYMDGVTDKFTEFYDFVVMGTDEFDAVGTLTYENDARASMFTEINTADEPLSTSQVKAIKAYNADKYLCDTDDVMMFTDKGWTYRTRLKNSDGKTMAMVTCHPSASLRGPSV